MNEHVLRWYGFLQRAREAGVISDSQMKRLRATVPGRNDAYLIEVLTDWKTGADETRELPK